MTDFAKLIMTADASGLKQGEQALDSLAAKGEQAESRVTKSTANLSKEFDRVVAAIGGVTDAQNRANDIAGQQVAALQKLIDQTQSLGSAAASAAPPVEAMKAAIADVGVEAQRTAKSYEAVNQMFTGQSGASTAMQAQINALTGVSRGASDAAQSAAVFGAKFDDAASRASKAGTRVKASTATIVKGMKDTGSAADSAGHRIRQMGWQLGQITQQGAATGNYLQAIGIQLGDILPMLGVGGIAGMAAMAGGILAPIAIGLLDVSSGADKMKESLDDLNDAIDDYERFAKLANASSKDLSEQFGNLSGLAREMYEGMAKLNHIKALQATKTAADDLRQQFAGLKNDLQDIAEAQSLGASGLDLTRTLVEGVADKYGLTVDQAKELMSLIDQMGKSGSMREQADATAAVARFLQDAVSNGADLKTETMDGAVAATDLALSTAQVAANTDEASGAMSSVVSQTDDWAAAMSGVRAEIGAIASALASMGGGVIANAGKFVELNALRQGRSIAEASRERQRLQMEAEFTAREAGAGTWVERMLIKGERALAERGMELDTELDDARDAARDRERAASRKSSGGGRKGRSGGGAKRDRLDGYERSVADIQSETEAFLRQADAMARVVAVGGDWEHALAVIEEEQKLLNAAQKAGVELTPEVRAGIKQMAEDYVDAEEKMDRIRTATERGQDAMKDLFGSILEGADSAKEALANLLSQIAQVQFAKAALGLLGGTEWGSQLIQTTGSLLSFDGGGYTGDGSRTGGIDGNGGFVGILHPQETVTDHTKGQQAGGGTMIVRATHDPGIILEVIDSRIGAASPSIQRGAVQQTIRQNRKSKSRFA